jgi:hypothetical protein
VGFVGTLRPYQERGLAWLEFLGDLGLGACLADDMGLGKTAQVLALLVAERPARTTDAPAGIAANAIRDTADASGPTLVVCPMSVVENWRREAQRFAPVLVVHVHHGSDRPGGKICDCDAGSTCHHDVRARRARRGSLAAIARLVLDEAQNIKNSAARQAQAVRRIRAPRRIALTGTPVENRLAELWSIMEVLNPGLLGSANAFRQRFAVPIERYGDDAAAGRLRLATAPFILRRLKSDRAIIADLPEKLEMTVYCSSRGTGHPVPGGRGRDARADRVERGDRAARARPRHDAAPQAGLQPPGPDARGRLGAPRAVRQAPAGGGDPRGGPRRG